MSLAFEERWANPPEGRVAQPGPATVPAGAGIVPAGTAEPWVMAGGWDQFPQANPAVEPPAILRVFDLADPREIIRVTDSRTGTWQVIRGDQGPVVAHAANFAVYNAVTAGGLTAKAQGLPSGHGLVLPDSGLFSESAPWLDGLQHNVVELYPGVLAGRNEVVPGAIYEALAWGYYSNTAVGDHFDAGVFWNIQSFGEIHWPCPRIVVPLDAARWRIHATLNVIRVGPDVQATCNALLTIADRNAVDTTGLFPYSCMFGRLAPVNVNIDQNVPFRVWVRQGVGRPWWVLGRRSWKAA